MLLHESLSDYQLLLKSWQKVRAGKTKMQRETSRGVDGVTIAGFEVNAPNNLLLLQEQIANKNYKFYPLKPRLIAKPKKDKDRLICIPAVADRVVHRAFMHLLNKVAFNTINNNVSYCGVRENTFIKSPVFQRKNIKTALEKFRDKVGEGCYFVFGADIEGFFDSVHKQRLIDKVSSILGEDRSVDWLLKQIVEFEIYGSDKLKDNPRCPSLPTPESEIGIPQGSSLSPLLSNIYLAEFDSNMNKHFGDNYIRYADDFAVLVPKYDDIAYAESLSKSYLASEGLSLSLDKTKRVAFLSDDAGCYLDFLGLRVDKYGIVAKNNLADIKRLFNEVILNPNSGKLYKVGRHFLKPSQKSRKMNRVIKGWGEFYRFYHAKPLYETINDLILKKKNMKSKIFQQIEPLDMDRLQPIISVDEWRQLFV